MNGSFQRFNKAMEQLGLSMSFRPPVTGTSIAIRVALLSLEGVLDVIVEGPMDRKIVPEGHIRITVHWGHADDIANRLSEVLSAVVATDGFAGGASAAGVWYWFDHVEPSIRPSRRPWYRRLWDWLPRVPRLRWEGAR